MFNLKKILLCTAFIACSFAENRANELDCIFMNNNVGDTFNILEPNHLKGPEFQFYGIGARNTEQYMRLYGLISHGSDFPMLVEIARNRDNDHCIITLFRLENDHSNIRGYTLKKFTRDCTIGIKDKYGLYEIITRRPIQAEGNPQENEIRYFESLIDILPTYLPLIVQSINNNRNMNRNRLYIHNIPLYLTFLNQRLMEQQFKPTGNIENLLNKLIK